MSKSANFTQQAGSTQFSNISTQFLCTSTQFSYTSTQVVRSFQISVRSFRVLVRSFRIPVRSFRIPARSFRIRLRLAEWISWSSRLVKLAAKMLNNQEQAKADATAAATRRRNWPRSLLRLTDRQLGKMLMQGSPQLPSD